MFKVGENVLYKKTSWAGDVHETEIVTIVEIIDDFTFIVHGKCNMIVHINEISKLERPTPFGTII